MVPSFYKVSRQQQRVNRRISAFHKLLEISQNQGQYVARNFSKVAQKKSKVAFCNESCSKVAPKKQTKNFVALFLIWFDAKVQQKEISKLSIVIQSNSNFKRVVFL